jgi:hypothetical protein
VRFITTRVYDPADWSGTVILPGYTGIDGSGNETRVIPFPEDTVRHMKYLGEPEEEGGAEQNDLSLGDP